MRSLLMLSLACFAFCGTAFCEESAPSVGKSSNYLGIKPGSNDTAPGKVDVKSKGEIAYVTWVGFQPTNAQSGQVFLQSTETLSYKIVESGGNKLVLEFDHAKMQSKNDARPLDTSAFETVITRITTSQRGRSLRLTIDLRKSATHQIRQEGKYLFIDFSTGAN